MYLRRIGSREGAAAKRTGLKGRRDVRSLVTEVKEGEGAAKAGE